MFTKLALALALFFFIIFPKSFHTIFYINIFDKNFRTFICVWYSAFKNIFSKLCFIKIIFFRDLY